MRHRTPLLLGVLFAASASNGVAQDQRQIRFVYPGQWPNAPVYFNGVFVGPYTGSLPGMPYLDLYCVDFIHGIRENPWVANFTSMADLMNGVGIENTRWGQVFGASSVAGYKKAVWLAKQFAMNATGSWGGIHGAIWNLFTPGQPPWAEAAPWFAAVDAAEQSGALDNIAWQNWAVVTDVNVQDGYGGNQEYLTLVTPEPGTLLLLITGVFAIVVVASINRRVA